MADKPKDYEVGYGKPPKHTQFRKGQSGNPKGRPKGTRNLKTVLAAELNKRIDIREGDQRRRVSKQEALIMRLIDKGLSGDPRALSTALNLMIRAYGLEDAEASGAGLSAADQDILAAYLSQAAQSDEASAAAPDDTSEKEADGVTSEAQTVDERGRDADDDG